MKNTKKKVLFLIHTLQVGGAERVLVDLVNNLPKNKYDITVMTVVNVGALRKQLKPNIKYKTIFDFKFLKKLGGGEKKYEASTNTSSKKNIFKECFIKAYIAFWKHANIAKLYKKHIKEKYDVEISFLEGIPAKIIANSNNPDSKKICWIHVDVSNENKSERFFKNTKEQKDVYNKFDKIVCVSNVVKEEFKKKTGIKEEKLEVVYNPIDVEKIKKKSIEEKLEKNKVFTFCSVGRLAKQKGYDRLINVCERLNNEGYSFKIQIIGEGVERSTLEKMISEKGIENFELMGYKSNPYPYIKNADCFVCSSRAEGFSTVVAEALVLGKPIISTDCSGAKELLGDNKYGIICENSEEGLYESMKSVVCGKRKISIKSNAPFSLKRAVFAIEDILDSKNNIPLVSIIIPVYNGEKYIRKCLDGLKMQTYRNIEVVIIDDGSTDGTKNIISEYNFGCLGKKIIHTKNSGVSHARNLGIKEATGKYVMFLDVDDSLVGDAIEKCVWYMKEQGSDLIRFSYKCVSNDKRIYNKRYISREQLKQGNYFDPIKTIAPHFNTGDIQSFGCLVFCKSSICKKCSFPENIHYMEDYHFIMELLKKSRNVYIAKDVFYLYRQDKGTASRSIDIDKRIDGIDSRYAVLRAYMCQNNKNIEKQTAINKLINIYLKTELYIANNIAENKEFDYTKYNDLVLSKVFNIMKENNIRLNSLSTENKALLFLARKKNVTLLRISACFYKKAMMLRGKNA